MTPRNSVATFLLSHDPAIAFLTPKVSPNTDWNIVRARESKSGTEVLLVAAMHFNPVSIELARETVLQEGNAGRLHAVAIEQCPTRWRAAEESGLRKKGGWKRTILENEFYSTADAAESLGKELILADVEAVDTFRRADEVIELTLKQLFTPWSDAGGWDKIAADFGRLISQAFGKDSRGPFILLNPQVMIYWPISILRYPLAYALRAIGGMKKAERKLKGKEDSEGGRTMAAFLFGPTLIALLLDTLADAAGIDFWDAIPDEFSYALSLVWYVTFFRTLWVGFLEERNDVLAQNIRNACLDAKPGSSVVAVLGAMHCDGVAQLLRESGKA